MISLKTLVPQFEKITPSNYVDISLYKNTKEYSDVIKSSISHMKGIVGRKDYSDYPFPLEAICAPALGIPLNIVVYNGEVYINLKITRRSNETQAVYENDINQFFIGKSELLNNYRSTSIDIDYFDVDGKQITEENVIGNKSFWLQKEFDKCNGKLATDNKFDINKHVYKNIDKAQQILEITKKAVGLGEEVYKIVKE